MVKTSPSSPENLRDHPPLKQGLRPRIYEILKPTDQALRDHPPLKQGLIRGV